MATSRSEQPGPGADGSQACIVVRGHPSGQELAAVVAVLEAVLADRPPGGGSAPGGAGGSAWVGRERIVGRILGPSAVARWGGAARAGW